MLSESGVYALLVYHYVPGNRLLREWLTHQVVPALRDAEHSEHSDRPMLSLLDWPEMSLSLLHWQDEGWIRLRDMPYLLHDRTQRRVTVVKPWWRKSCAGVSVVEALDGLADLFVGSTAEISRYFL